MKINNQRIQLQNIKKKFGNDNVLNSVNLTVNSGEIVGLIGPSGSGKSTTIKILLGMEKADEGEALILEKRMPNRKLLADIGYMAQSDALYESMTARENLRFFGYMKDVAKKELPKEIEYVAEVVDLTNYLDKKVSGYSGGMKRRLSLAKPKIIILDEPTVGIDPALRLKIWKELAKLRDEGRSILVTTHVMSEAELTDRVALLFEGKIIAFDKPKKLEDEYEVNNIEEVFLKVEGE